MYRHIFLIVCLSFTCAEQVWAQRAVLPEPVLKSIKFAGKDLLAKDSICTIVRGVEYELEIEAEPGSFSATRDNEILEVMCARKTDGLKVIVQMASYKIVRLADRERATAKFKIPAETPPYLAQLRILEKNSVLIHRNLSIVAEK